MERSINKFMIAHPSLIPKKQSYRSYRPRILFPAQSPLAMRRPFEPKPAGISDPIRSPGGSSGSSVTAAVPVCALPPIQVSRRNRLWNPDLELYDPLSGYCVDI